MMTASIFSHYRLAQQSTTILRVRQAAQRSRHVLRSARPGHTVAAAEGAAQPDFLTRRDFVGNRHLVEKSAISNIVPFRRCQFLSGTPTRQVAKQLQFEMDPQGVERLRLESSGWNTWQWGEHKVNWLAAGDRGPPVVLVHGYGGSVYHWRYNIPQLARHCRVYALDCLGFGWSDKPLTDYRGIWAQQIADFVHDVVGEPAILVGNSLGGYNALQTAALQPEVARGVVLLNAAGAFERSRQASATATATSATAFAAFAASASALRSTTTAVQPLFAGEGAPVPAPASVLALPPPTSWGRAFNWVRDGTLRRVVSLYYKYMRQQSSIRRALHKLYVHKSHVDDDLVRSVAIPAAHPAAEQVVFLLLKAAMSAVPLNCLLDRMASCSKPLLLLWGEKDPWTLHDIPRRICRHYPSALLQTLPAGHCPQNDTPHLVNSKLLAWVAQLDRSSRRMRPQRMVLAA